MVRTLKNAFASGRIAHAFMLTGVRGVGKTTTARLLARALNYESDTVHAAERRPDLAVEGVSLRLHHRRAASSDVLEVDAASQSKVDEMRESAGGGALPPPPRHALQGLCHRRGAHAEHQRRRSTPC